VRDHESANAPDGRGTDHEAHRRTLNGLGRARRERYTNAFATYGDVNSASVAP
jgi:hypothetical protein